MDKDIKEPSFFERLRNREDLRRISWDIFVVCLIFYNSVVVTFNLAFQEVSWWRINVALDLLFVGDVILHAMTFSSKEMIVKGVHLDGGYIKGPSIYIDVISLIPFELFTYISNSGVVKAMQVLSLLRILRLRRTRDLYTALLSRYRIANVLNGFVMVTVFTVTVHWVGCGLFALGKSSKNDNSWIDEIELRNDNLYDQYTTALYFALVTLSTLGYGEIVPANTNEKMTIMLVIFIGAMLYTWLTATMTNMITTMSIQTSKYTEKMSTINNYMSFMQVPEIVQCNVRGYYQYMWAKQKAFDASWEDIFADLPDLLYSEIADGRHKAMFSKNMYFSECRPDVLRVRIFCDFAVFSVF
eukprot:TRINITY_DN526371_c0_g5_i1.p1 TRINITY_DN526371_c0_g5~~TRINITY_DN526371_c0_g5_i1.p1  ORF type:complete len:356 (-),score=49.28 TRINITY_DN526371_c0_g5_i1:106-1173(-)